MAFSLRKMFSNISYFSKSGDKNSSGEYQRDESPSPPYFRRQPSSTLNFEAIEPDSTSKPASSLKLPTVVKKFSATKGSLSDTDLSKNVSKIRKTKNLKLDIKKASQSMSENLFNTDGTYIENTPKHILLDSKSADLFSEKFRRLNFSHSEFDITSESSEEELYIESLSECSDTDASVKNDIENVEVKMCRKVESKCEIIPSATPESFGDFEMDKTEEERESLLLDYQMKFEKVECVLKKLLSEFQFHIEVSKIFNERSIVTALPGTDVSDIPKALGHVTYMDNVSRASPTESWNIIMAKEDVITKSKFRNQLLSLKNCLENFTSHCLQNVQVKDVKPHRVHRSNTFDIHKGKRVPRMKKNIKKCKYFDFPDYRDAFINLFDMDIEKDELDNQLLHSQDEFSEKCYCRCHNDSQNQSDSGLTMKSDNFSTQSITSSIGNFSLDSNTLSAYSESLDLVISYNSFQDTSLINILLQKPAIERITFYVQVHSIQLNNESIDGDNSKNTISFFCPSCEVTENEEDGLLRHILSQKHCEKIHFAYKTAYIKKCVASGKEIQPSTVLNPMRMYRDDNKIVCFGDAMYACTLCFENLFVGESILMAHCNDETHLDRKDMLSEMFE